MKFQFIANACGIFISKKGTKILTDPWIVDGVFDGSWCHFHKLQTKVSDLQNVDAIYVSHIHPDHYDERFFDFNKDIPIIVLDHKMNFLIKNLLKKGNNADIGCHIKYYRKPNYYSPDISTMLQFLHL